MPSTIAIVMSEVFLRRLTPSLTPFVRRQQDFHILSIHRPIEELRQRLQDLQPAGLITEWLPAITDRLLQLELPTVIADTDFTYPGVTSIDVDDHAVGAEAARAFLEAGYRSFACLGNGAPYSDQRIHGFRQALEADTSCSVHTEPSLLEARYSESFTSPSDAMQQWLHDLPKPVGIFAVHDPLGRFLCGACQTLGLKVPEQVAVIGANNDELVCGLSYPMLSSVAIPWEKIGAVVGEAMERQLAGETAPPSPIQIPPGGVVLRHSANHLAVEDEMLRRAMSYLSEHLQDPISIGELCHDLRIARRSLERKFREFYRCTPWEMLCRMRVRHARHLLVQTNHPISRIAELCGFNDPERMAVVFKRITHQSPSHFRRTPRPG
ncbi:substrate-binding domain-containing protein [Haloferula rosea]|uniref:Substrate-binding domain-containing protein n=2 Tax=Haloferula rosea TaxID=490093 RepID=A0A934RET3_9BACT|nr:substrate-binding domain-containing protein [Haloferula rosea]